MQLVIITLSEMSLISPILVLDLRRMYFLYVWIRQESRRKKRDYLEETRIKKWREGSQWVLNMVKVNDLIRQCKHIYGIYDNK